MREILFRGKAIDGNWYYGVPLVFTEDYVCMTAPHTYNKSVELNTLGQYTGLTDKNGTKIFEGDIVEGLDFTAEDGGYGVVTFDDGAFEVVGSCYNNIVGTFHENYYGKDFEVIGNIHDNPELLKGEEQ